MKSKVRFTDRPSQARVFVRAETAVKWAKESGGRIASIGVDLGRCFVPTGYVVYHNEKGWVR